MTVHLDPTIGVAWCRFRLEQAQVGMAIANPSLHRFKLRGQAVTEPRSDVWVERILVSGLLRVV
jgi:hypothetical protein